MTRHSNFLVLSLILILTANCILPQRTTTTKDPVNERKKLYEKNLKNAPSKMFRAIVNIVIMVYRGTFSIAFKMQENFISGWSYLKEGLGMITDTIVEEEDEDGTPSNDPSTTADKKTYAKKIINEILNTVKAYIGEDAPLIKIAVLHGIGITMFYLLSICFIILRSIFFKTYSLQSSRRRRELNSRNLKENFIPANLADHKKTYHFDENRDSTIIN
uniref:Bap31 domain-containing protein n=1 Tax=Strongyloides papillosus TaxID=174720 RepID=A0A0N5BGK7_STREA